MELWVAIVKKTVYVVGGSTTYNTNPNSLSSMEAHVVGSSEWVMKASMSTERMFLGVAELEGQVCATGGVDKYAVTLSSKKER